MTSSLVGSEMCIRDSLNACRVPSIYAPCKTASCPFDRTGHVEANTKWSCLLYTSDAADDM
eukprot:12086355-Prorocentrum_lima.AAC.1